MANGADLFPGGGRLLPAPMSRRGGVRRGGPACAWLPGRLPCCRLVTPITGVQATTAEHNKQGRNSGVDNSSLNHNGGNTFKHCFFAVLFCSTAVGPRKSTGTLLAS
jgi:hypothetical protein